MTEQAVTEQAVIDARARRPWRPAVEVLARLAVAVVLAATASVLLGWNRTTHSFIPQCSNVWGDVSCALSAGTVFWSTLPVAGVLVLAPLLRDRGRSLRSR